LDTPSADGDIASFPGADGGEPSRDGPDSSPNDNFDLSDLPIGPLLICSPSFDLSSPSPPATIRTSSYSTTITCLGVVLRRGEWVIVVGCADGFVHLVSRESRARYLAGRGIAEGRAADEIKDSKYARYIHPHPIDLPAGFPASLLYTLADPSPHGTTTKMPPCLQLVCSLDGGMIITIDGAGTIRRWDLNNRALSGVTHTDGLVESVQTGSSHLFGQAHHSALHGQHLPVWMDLIYPSSQSDLAVLYGAGGALQGMHGGGGRDSQPSRSGSFSMRASEEGLEGLMRPGAINSLLSSSADPSSSPPLSTKGSHSPSAASTVLSPALLLSQGLLLPTHVVIFSSGTWSLFRTTRAPRVSKHASSQAAQNSKTGIAGSGSGLLADIADFLAASYLDARKTMDSLGPSQGDKLRKERAAVEARAAAARKRSQNLQARDGMTSTETAGGGRESMNSGFGSPDSLHTSTSFHQSSTSPPVSPPHSAVLPAGTHISLSATPFHPGGLEVSSLASTRPASAGRGGEMVGLEGKIEVEGEEEVPQEREQAEPIRPVKVSEFFGFDLPTEETGGSGDMAGGQMNGPLGAGNGSSSEPKTGSAADITIRLDGHDGADHAQHQEQEEAAQE
jgi:hypothetical protein